MNIRDELTTQKNPYERGAGKKGKDGYCSQQFFFKALLVKMKNKNIFSGNFKNRKNRS